MLKNIIPFHRPSVRTTQAPATAPASDPLPLWKLKAGIHEAGLRYVGIQDDYGVLNGSLVLFQAGQGGTTHAVPLRVFQENLQDALQFCKQKAGLLQHEKFIIRRTDDLSFLDDAHNWTPDIQFARLFNSEDAQRVLGQLREYNQQVQLLSCKAMPVKPRRPQAGIAGIFLLEILVAMMILATLFAMAVPNFQRIQLDNQQSNAKQRMQLIANARSVVATDQSMQPPVQAPAAQAIIPANGSTVQMQGYTYTAAPDGSTLTATPTNASAGQTTFSIDSSNVLFCGGSPCVF